MYQSITHRSRALKLTQTLSLLIFFALLSSVQTLAQGGGCDDTASALSQAERLRVEWKSTGLKKAIGKYREALACFHLAGRKGEEADALKRIGDISFSLSDYEEARKAYETALQLRKAAGDTAAEARVLADLSTVLAFLGQNDGAAPLAQQALVLSRQAGDKRAEAHALNSLGLLGYLRGELQQALEKFNQTLSLARETGDVEEEAQALLHLGWVHQETNEIEQALKDYNQALRLWRSLHNRPGEVKAITAMGLAYIVLGESQKALECLDGQALPALRDMGDRTGEAAAHNNIAYLHRTLGEDELALKHQLQALEIFNQVNLAVGQAVTAQYIGYSYELLGKEQEAIRYYEQALAAARSINNPLIEADTLNSIGAMKLSLGMNQIAFEHFQRSLAAYQKAGQMWGQAAALTGLGSYFETVGDKPKAIEHYERALTINRAIGDRHAEMDTLFYVTRTELGLGLLDSARQHIESALKLSESLRAKVSGQEARTSYFASVHRQFELYIDVLMRQHEQRPTENYQVAAFEASERGRARSLLESLAEAHRGIRQGVDTALLERERELQRQLNAKVERRIHLGADAASAQEVAALDEELDALTAQYQQVQGQIRSSSPRYAALVQPIPLSLREIQQKVLDENTLLMEYALGEERSFVWTVTPGSIKSFELPKRTVIEHAARKVYELLTARNRQLKGESDRQMLARFARAEEQYAEASRELSRMLLAPFAGELQRKRLVIVADGALQYVPFGALPVPASKAATENDSLALRAPISASPRPSFIPLITEHEVVSLPSASVLALMREELRERPPAPKSVAVLADPVFDSDDERLVSLRTPGQHRYADRAARQQAGVSTGGESAILTQKALRDFDGLGKSAGLARLPFSRREAESIRALLPAGDGMFALGFRASRAMATSPELSHFRVVHFATHGLLNSEHPELSGIVLSFFDEAGKRQDGFLQLSEIYNLNLPADLVVLSACQTALGKEVRGEGLVGLTRGFMYAGAARVMASLWKVDDAATAELMREFYKAMLADGLKPAEALRAAQIHLWQQNRWHSPYYWAAFMLQGEWK